MLDISLPGFRKAALRREEERSLVLTQFGVLTKPGDTVELQPRVPIFSFHLGASSCWKLWKGDPFRTRKWVQMTGRDIERNVQVLFSEIILLFQLPSHFKSFNKHPSSLRCNADCMGHLSLCLVVTHSLNETIDFFLMQSANTTVFDCIFVWPPELVMAPFLNDGGIRSSRKFILPPWRNRSIACNERQLATIQQF